VVIQMPPTSIWSQLLPSLVGVLGVVLGVFVTTRATQRRERDQHVWQRRCELYLLAFQDVRKVEDAIVEWQDWEIGAHRRRRRRQRKQGEPEPEPTDTEVAHPEPTPPTLVFEDPDRLDELWMYGTESLVNSVGMFCREYREEWLRYHEDGVRRLLREEANVIRSRISREMGLFEVPLRDRMEERKWTLYSWMRRPLHWKRIKRLRRRVEQWRRRWNFRQKKMKDI
jgi:hypothetical protein